MEVRYLINNRYKGSLAFEAECLVVSLEVKLVLLQFDKKTFNFVGRRHSAEEAWQFVGMMMKWNLMGFICFFVVHDKNWKVQWPAQVTLWDSKEGEVGNPEHQVKPFPLFCQVLPSCSWSDPLSEPFLLAFRVMLKEVGKTLAVHSSGDKKKGDRRKKEKKSNTNA